MDCVGARELLSLDRGTVASIMSDITNLWDSQGRSRSYGSSELPSPPKARGSKHEETTPQWARTILELGLSTDVGLRQLVEAFTQDGWKQRTSYFHTVVKEPRVDRVELKSKELPSYATRSRTSKA